MFSEIFGLLGSIDVIKSEAGQKFRVNLNKNRIRSISAYSSNTIFYFPVGVSDQCTPEEVAMVSRLVEKTCASFVVACISLMPFHRVRADDKAAIEDYLAQFHQNIGMNLGPGPIMNKAMSLVESSGNISSEDIKEAQDFLLEMWNASKQNCSEFVKLVANDVSLNEMYSVDPIDPKTKVIQARFKEINEEYNVWGFIGEATDDMFDSMDDLDDEEFDDDDMEDLYDDVDPEDYPEEAYEQIINSIDESSSKLNFDDEFKRCKDKLKARRNHSKLRYAAERALVAGALKMYEVKRMIKAATTEDQLKQAYSLASEFSDGHLYDTVYAADIIRQAKKIGCKSPIPGMENIDETSLKSSVRNKLSDDMFGLPTQRKYPLHDKKHVKLAIQMFGHCPESDRPELARNIKKAAQKFNISINVGKDAAAADYLAESAVIRKAVNTIKFSLESVSENKIKSAKNLTKLRTLEAKLKKLKNKYTKYLNRYKKKYNENKRKGSKSKLSIRFNGLSIDNPKAFMVQYGKFIKIINKRLKMVEDRRNELNKRNGTPSGTKNTGVPGVEEIKNVEESIGIDEAIQLADHCLKQIDKDLNAPDSDIFSYEDDDDDDDEFLDEASNNRNPRGNNNNNRNNNNNASRGNPYQAARNARRRTVEAERQRDREASRANVAERNTERYRTLLNQTRERLNQTREKLTAAQAEARDARRNAVADNELTRAERAQRDREESDKEFDMEYDSTRMKSGINPYRAADARHTEFHTFDKEVFTNMDMNKANEAIPTFAKASIGFVIDETEEVVSRDVLVGIKAYIHKIPTAEMVSDAYNCVINRRRFLRFIKFITGEERSLSDLVFGIKELRNDALNTRNGSAGKWQAAIKRRRRWSKIAIPYLMREYTPNGTIVMTMNEVDYIKSEYGVDIMTPEHVKMIMDTDFLLAFIILDQSNETLYVTYDGHGYGFQEYTYAMMERDSKNNGGQKELMQLYRAITR